MLRRSLLTTALAACGVAGGGLAASRARAAAAAGAATAGPLVTADRILFGQSAARTVPAASMGVGMRQGILAAFAEANKAGGVKGRKLEFVSKDDGYEPARSVAATRDLLEKDRVFALVGSVGTPNSAKTLPVIAEVEAPYVGPYTGAELLRDALLDNVANVRASYAQETEVIVERLTKDLGATKIACFYQNDAYSNAGLSGVKLALSKRNLPLAAEGTYERNTAAVRDAVLAIQKAQPEAVVLVSVHKSGVEFVRVAKEVGLKAALVAISPVTGLFAADLGAAGAGVVVTQIVPFPRDPSVPVVKRYQGALKAVEPSAAPEFVSLEGYLVGRLVVAALGRLDGVPTREAFLNTILGGAPFDVDGFVLKYGAGDNQVSDRVFLIAIGPDGAFRAIYRLQKG